jgi:hypothetical protein
MDCGSGFPAANRFNDGIADRGWKAAPTFKPTPKILKLTPLRRRREYKMGFLNHFYILSQKYL